MERFSRDVLWRRVTSDGIEHVLLDDAEGLRARGTMTAAEPQPYTCRYSLATNQQWVVTTLEVETEGAGWRRRVRLERDSSGWRITANEHGDLEPSLPGIEAPEVLNAAVDPDLGFSPLFNTLPVRRLDLMGRPTGTSETLMMAFIIVPSLVVTPSEQTYTVMGDGRIGYTSGTFTAELQFDPDGYVRHYPGLATRVV
ncbi:MAG: putative glycolipid-binding domain-containing protein [Micromonosporaceae bacterium]